MLLCPSGENSAGELLKKKKMRKLEVAITPETRVLNQSSRHISFELCLKMHLPITFKLTSPTLGDLSREEIARQRKQIDKAAIKLQDSTNSSEINELKQRLHTANLQIAEVVAQSVISVRDVESAASKKIADALRNAQAGDVKRNLRLSTTTQTVRGFDYVGVGASDQELAVTRQELAECKSMLAIMKRQLDRTLREKDKLETYLRSSVETSLKLERTLANQKAVMQLELLTAEDQCRNEFAGLVQSARHESKHLQGQLDAAMLSKAESDFLLRGCIRLLLHAQSKFSQLKAPSSRQCCFQSVVQGTYQQLQLNRAQAQMQRESLYEAAAENAISWTVLECTWEGAVQSLLERQRFLSNDKLHARTLKRLGRVAKQPGSDAQKFFCSSEEVTTPLKRTLLKTPRIPVLEMSHPEDVLRQNLIKSEQEVEILGDKVDELRIILEKVTLLLDCISKSSVTGHETKVLMRRIIEQLQTFETGSEHTWKTNLEDKAETFTQALVIEALVSHLEDLENANDEEENGDEDKDDQAGTSRHPSLDDDDDNDQDQHGTSPSSGGTATEPPPTSQSEPPALEDTEPKHKDATGTIGEGQL
ncbi:hypothetical protein L7F22_020745 [Adiantum nelumboides]|nr:hypothetical protein [Adiantum nelumboides]